MQQLVILLDGMMQPYMELLMACLLALAVHDYSPCVKNNKEYHNADTRVTGFEISLSLTITPTPNLEAS